MRNFRDLGMKTFTSLAITMKNLLRSLLACGFLAMMPAASNAAIIMNIYDDGVDLFMTATGSYDFTNAATGSVSGLGENAAVAPTALLFGWETGDGTTVGYSATYTGVLTGTLNAFPATSTTTTNPFFFWPLSNAIEVEIGNPLVGLVNETAVFSGTTFASLGMLPGETVTVSWGNGGADEIGSISTGVVHLPAAAWLFGSALLGLGVVKRRKV
jgi:hypothetical protein